MGFVDKLHLVIEVVYKEAALEEPALEEAALGKAAQDGFASHK